MSSISSGRSLIYFKAILCTLLCALALTPARTLASATVDDSNARDHAAALSRFHYSKPTAKPAAQTQSRRPGPPSNPALDQRCASLLKWSQQLDSAYPGKDFAHFSITPAMVVPLFDDAAFIPFFGKPYDQITSQERNNFSVNAVNACLNSAHRKDFSWQMDIMVLAFRTQSLGNGPYMPTQLIAEVQSLRQARAQLKTLEQQIPAVPASPQGYDELVQIRKTAAPSLQQVWPAEQSAFNNAVSAAIQRAAGPTLDAKLQPLVAGAKGHDGVAALEKASTQYKELFTAVSPAEKTKWQQAIEAKIGVIYQQQMAEQQALLDKIDSGAGGLEQGAQWYAGFSQYSGDMDRPEVARVMQNFRTKRAAQIAAVEPQMAKAIQSARTGQEATAVLPQYLSVPGDDSAPGIDKLRTMAQERAAQLHRNEMLKGQVTEASSSKSSEDSSAARPSHDKGASSGNGPTAAQIYDSLQARVDSYNGGRDDLAQQCKNLRAHGQQDPVLALQCLSVWAINGGETNNPRYDLKVKITNFKFIGCEKSLQHVGYNCTYIVALSQNNPAMETALGAMMEGSNITEARFLRVGNQWVMAP